MLLSSHFAEKAANKPELLCPTPEICLQSLTTKVYTVSLVFRHTKSLSGCLNQLSLCVWIPEYIPYFFIVPVG